jgi:hypothetical protein
VSADGLAYEPFAGSRGQLWMMRIGAAAAPPIVFVPALFEEMNRTRALVAATMRALAARGFGCWLTDLAGTGESEAALAEASWRDWRHDVGAAAAHAGKQAGTAPLLAAVRGGALIDDAAAAIGRWRLAPVDGAKLVRDMERAGFGGGEWAGYAPSADVKGFLADARPATQTPLRVVRLASDPGEADAKIDGPALWRRSEPGSSPDLALAMAADIAEWHATCAAR